MALYNTNISNFIEQQFPSIYREEGELFVDFVRTYYEWLEQSSNVIGKSRSLLDNIDIDSTIEEFLIFFKQKYLRNIQFDVSTDIPQLVKHSLDIYRSKGTERCIDLFFRLVYGVPASVYYPAKDILRLSDGDWYIPKYLEVSATEVNRLMVGRQIYGLNSGAKAFVERLVRRSIGASYREVFMVSAVSGTFEAGEQIRLSIDNNYTEWPFLLGSLTGLEVIDGGNDFAVGDIVETKGNKTTTALARVSAIQKKTGLVDFDLIDGGFGYTANCNVYVTDVTLKLDNVRLLSNGGYDVIYEELKQLNQDIFDLTFTNASSFPVEMDILKTYYPNTELKSTSRVLSVDSINTTAGSLQAIILSGNAESNVYYIDTQSNATIEQTANGYTYSAVIGDIFGISSNVQIVYSNATNQFVNNSIVYQLDFRGNIMSYGTILSLTTEANAGVLKVRVDGGVFVSDRNIMSADSNTVAYPDYMKLDIGIKYFYNANKFVDLPGNFVYNTRTGSNGSIVSISKGDGADFSVANTLAFTEIVSLNTDVLLPYSNVSLNASSFGLYLGLANLSSNIGTSLNYDDFTIGTLTRLTAINPGADYNYPPFTLLYEPLVAAYAKKDFLIYFTDETGPFSVGEIVEQDATGSIGIVKAVESNFIKVRRLKFDDTWVAGSSNTDYLILGTLSGTTAKIDFIIADETSRSAGLNAIVQSNVVTSESSIQTLQVIDSGYGYYDNEELEIVSKDGTRTGRAIAKVTSIGKGSGYSRNNNSFLSANKKLHDGNYYQDFAYEIRSPVSIERYTDMLREVLHVSGMKYFSAIVRKSIIDTRVSIAGSIRE